MFLTSTSKKITPEDLPRHWREERAFRLGKPVVSVALVLTLIALIANFQFAGWLEITADLFLIAGCLLSLYLSKRSQQKRQFVIWPFYIGFIVATVPSTLLSGGIYSPWLAAYVLALVTMGSTLQTRLSPAVHTVFGALILVACFFYTKTFISLPEATAYIQNFPPIFMLVGASVMLVGIGYCLHGLLRTERELSREIERQYAELYQTKATLTREESANQAKSAFLANISHELRTPLAAIVGYASLIRGGDASATEKESFAATIERNGQQLARLVDDLLDLSKVEAGRIEIEKIETKLIELISDTLALLNLNAKKKAVRLSVFFADPIPEIVKTDPFRLKQILMNVLGNALKFTDKGDIEVTVAFKNEVLKIAVKDTGRGIAPSERDKLFKRFSQADASMTRRYGGTGLGLNFSRELAKLLGGDLELTWSQLGFGSEFTLTLPTEVPAGVRFQNRFADASQRPAGQASLPVAFNFKGSRILVVDDSADNRDLIQRFLVPTGAVIEEAADGIEALEKVDSHAYDLILMDVQMPRLDGLQATSQLRKKNFTAPIVAITAHAMKEDRERCLEAGCDNHLAKPIQRLELMQVINTHLA